MLPIAGILLLVIGHSLSRDEPLFVKNPEDICEDIADPGPCQYYSVRWFWDKVDDTCKEFHYGGCMGNKNNFKTKQQCVKQCQYKLFNPVAVPDLCLLEVNQGHCGDERRGQWWWFFNSDSGECEKFFYYGCGGNDNKFYSLHMCRKVCAERLSPQIACDTCDLRTSFCKSHSKFNYTCECRVGYEKNQYGECIDIDECRGYERICDKNAWCTNTIGSYSCECMASYRGDGRHCTYVGLGRSSIDCKDCSPDATCDNGVCKCMEGFQGDGFNCTDVNECMKQPYVCDKNAECINRNGSFICTCLAGYAGTGYPGNCTQSKNSCLDKFNRDYQEPCGHENWRPHYYLDHQTRMCQQFWYDGCPGLSRNIFSELETCESMCEETNVLTRAGSGTVITAFHHISLFTQTVAAISRSAVDILKQFFNGYCTFNTIYGNNLTTLSFCTPPGVEACVSARLPDKVCWDKFDLNYRNQCLNGQWEQRYYFDHASLTCRQFWFDGCRSDSRNMFEDVLTCQWLCEAQPMYKSRACLEDFDHNLKNMCNGGRWRQQWYFDKNIKRCQTFWYDGCKGSNENIFQDEQSCLLTCENPTKKDPRKPWHNNDKHKMKEALGEIFKPNKTDDICEEDDPCENEGICIWVWKKNTYYCKCKAGYTGTNCEKKIEFDPCASAPCKNGATCQIKSDNKKPTYECFCATGFGGPLCDQKPCDINPCLNNGTCRTTSGYSTYFCDCRDGFGGKNCDIAIGKNPPEEKYGSKVELVSSGKEEWVQQMKQRLGSKKKADTPTSGSNTAAVADEPYKDPATKKREREEREKKEAEQKEKEEMEQKEREAAEEQKKMEEALESERQYNITMANRNSDRILSIVYSIVFTIVFL